MNETILLCGPAGAGKTARITSEYVRHADRWGDESVALIAPTARVAGELCARIVGMSARRGLFDPRIYTFPLIAETLLDVNCRPVRRISDLQRRVLLADVCKRLARERRLQYLQAAAEFPGFVSAIGGLVDELKRAAVDPAQFTQAARRHLPDHPANDDVAAIYAAYQRTLTARGLYDEAGAFWEARDLLREGKRRPLDTVTLLVVDGFSEFTPTQLEMLQALCAGVPRAVITLCLEADGERSQLFAVTRRTHAALMERLPGAREKWLPAPEGATALERLRERLFAGAEPSAGPPPDDDGTVRLLGAPGARAEVRLIARHVKDLLLEGVAPGSVALVVRSPDAYEQPIREVFAQYGIPCRMSRGMPLAQCPAVQAVLDILDVVAGDWQRDDVVKLINSNYVDLAGLLPPERPLTADDFEALALQAGIIGGQPSWGRRLNLLSGRLQREGARARSAALEDEDDAPWRRDLREIERDSELVERSAMLLDALVNLLEPLARARTWREAAGALGRAVDALRIVPRALSAEADEQAAERDVAALHILFEALRELGTAAETLGADERLPPGESVQRIKELCRDLRLPPDRPGEDAVEVLDVYEARRTRHDEVFLPGMVEGAFPLARRQDAFYHDDARRRLNATRPVMEERLPRQAEEAFLLYEALAGAARRVWLSYPTSDVEGKPVLRSHYVDEVVGQFAVPPAEEVVRLSQVAPEARAACCPRELAEAAMRDAAAPALAAALRLMPDLLPRVVHAAQVEGERDSREPPGPHDGVLSSRTARAALAARFGPRHVFSAAQFGDYGHCPMAFFFKRVLGLEALEEPSEEVEVRDLGSLLHRALNVFFGERAHAGDYGAPLMPDMLPAARERMAEVWRDVCAGMRARAAHRKLWEITEAALLEDLLALLEYEAARNADGKDGPRAVWRTEQAYGAGGDFAVSHGGETLAVAGRIDRIDIIPGTTPLEFVLLDYKRTGGASAKAIQQGTDFQLPLYYLAAREQVFAGRAAECAWWAYYRLRRPPKFDGALYATPRRKGQLAVSDAVRVALDFMVDHARGMRDGRFAPLPAQCPSYCDFRGVCRHSPYRMKAKGTQ